MFPKVAESAYNFRIVAKFLPIILHLSVNSGFKGFPSIKLCTEQVIEDKPTEAFR